MIRSIEISKAQWNSFFERLDKSLEGRAVQIEGVNPVLGDQVIGSVLPFEGLAYEEKGSDAGALTLHVGINETELDHRVFHPEKVFVGLNDLTDLEWLAIEESDGGKTLIHFHDLPKLEEAHPQ